MCVSVCLPVFICTMCILGVHRGQKTVPDLLEFELQVAVIHCVCAEH